MIGKDKLRRFILIICLLLSLSILVVDYVFFTNFYNERLAYDTIINSKKDLLKGHVDRTIMDIEKTREEVILTYSLFAEIVAQNIMVELKEEGDPGLIAEQSSAWSQDVFSLNVDFQDTLDIIVVDKPSNRVLYATGDGINPGDIESILASSSVSSHMEDVRYELLVYMLDDRVDNIVKARIKVWISQLRLEGSEYLWVNEIINYEGGHDYAIRLIHPNLPDTEGILLSTETKDIAGNKPYLIELEGINQGGEVYFNYYFKEFESDKVSEKMTYAKLYERYDWVVATGIYMNDIQELKDLEAYDARRKALIVILIALSILVLIVLMGISWLNLRRINTALKLENSSQKESSDRLKEKMDMVATMAYRDHLTGVLNRRGLLVRLEEELSRHKRQSYPVSIVMVDVDYFKNINDSYGHDFGDEALKAIAQCINNKIRNEDIFGRLGGDEFLIVLPYAQESNAIAVAESILLEVNDDSFFQKRDIHITVSIGITSLEKDDTSDKVIKKADIAMYQSKRNGRNRCTVFENTLT